VLRPVGSLGQLTQLVLASGVYLLGPSRPLLLPGQAAIISHLFFFNGEISSQLLHPKNAHGFFLLDYTPYKINTKDQT
jgi:hypothetical protein